VTDVRPVCVPGQRVHIAIRERGAWLAACYQPLPREAESFGARGFGEVWRLGRLMGNVCLDCDGLLRKGPDAFVRATGWKLAA
jgi:hypothetical protein